jgi:hypothetical protein
MAGSVIAPIYWDSLDQDLPQSTPGGRIDGFPDETCLIQTVLSVHLWT